MSLQKIFKPLIIKKMLIKTTRRYHSIAIRMGTTKNRKSVGKDTEKSEPVQC